MNKKILLFLIIMLIISGCSNSVSKNSDPVNEEQVVHEIEKKEYDGKALIDQEIYEHNIELKKEKYEILNKKSDQNKFTAPLTGLKVSNDVTNRRPIVVMLDNYHTARPQAGVSEADIVYEILAEGRITRYMAVFQSSLPDNLGPVRSARPYFIKKALEYNPFYVHVGGSQQALIDIDNYSISDIDGLSSGSNTFWRTSHKIIPHNMYTSSNAIIKEGKRKGYNREIEINYDLISEEEINLDNGKDAVKIDIVYKKPGNRDKVGYTSQYRYNFEKENYERYVNNKKYIDENNNKSIYTDNIIIQYANTRVIDDYGRRKIDLVGQNKGYYITKGKVIDIVWKKISDRALTRYYDLNGNEIKINKGKTWIQVVPMNANITIK